MQTETKNRQKVDGQSEVTDARKSAPMVLPASIERNRMLGVEQTAAALGLSVPHVRRLYRMKKIPEPTRIGARKLGWPAYVVEGMLSGAKQRS